MDPEPVLVDLKAYHEAHNLWEVVPPDVPVVLERLRSRYTLAVVSSSNGTVQEKLRRVGLADYFATIVDSHVEGVEKPDPRIFRRALDRVGARSEETVHIGDIYHIDVAGARAAGLQGVLLDPSGAYAGWECARIGTLEEIEELLRVTSGK